jgi:hypothetical protein
MSTLDEINAAIEAHRAAVAAHERAHEVREMAAHRLCAMRPSNRASAIAMFEYLATLGNELEPGIAQMADLVLSRSPNTIHWTYDTWAGAKILDCHTRRGCPLVNR